MIGSARSGLMEEEGAKHLDDGGRVASKNGETKLSFSTFILSSLLESMILLLLLHGVTL